MACEASALEVAVSNFAVAVAMGKQLGVRASNQAREKNITFFAWKQASSHLMESVSIHTSCFHESFKLSSKTSSTIVDRMVHSDDIVHEA